MKVFVVGSLREIPAEQHSDFRGACRALGARFSRAGHTFILGSDAVDTADFYIVEGADAESERAPHEIRVYRANPDHRPFGDRSFRHVRIRTEEVFHTQEAAHARAVVDSDVVLLIGGRAKTAAAGNIAHALEKPYLPIRCFGGRAAELWMDFEATHKHYNVSESELAGVKWICDPEAVVSCCEKLKDGTSDALHRMQVRPFFRPPARLVIGAFMLMPLTDRRRDAVYEKHVKPVVAALGISIQRADDLFMTGEVMHQVWSSICAAQVVIADCTGRNPNVFYEVGIAHTLGKPTILISEKGQDVPFDLAHVRTVIYDNTPSGMQRFERGLGEALKQILGLN